MYFYYQQSEQVKIYRTVTTTCFGYSQQPSLVSTFHKGHTYSMEQSPS